MEWKILELTKENTIKKQITDFYHVLNNFQTEIIADIHPKLISNSLFCEAKNWWYVKKEGLHAYMMDNELCFANGDSRSNYASFMEKNVAFSRFPKHLIRVMPGETLSIQMEAECSQGVTVKLAIAEYNEHEKEVTTLISLQKEQHVIVGKNTKYLRLALKITGKGIVRIKNACVERIFEKRKVETIIRNPVQEVKSFRDLKVACIFDEFTMSNFQNEVELITFTPENWKTVLTKEKPHLLFVESAWHGNGGAWEYQIGKYSNVSRDALFELLKWCKKRDIPTLFWNKEDPIHFDKFIDTAKRFDYIYTTDANIIPEYKKRAKHERVFALPFAAEPTRHNPIQLATPRENKICFAGSYYANRHLERRQIMDTMLEFSQEFGLAIYDRNFERPEPEFRFPEKFKQNVIGSLRYDEIDKAYKGYRFMLNVNSVIHSPTMFSRRVFEGLASGTPILSSYSKGIEALFGNIVMISEEPNDLRAQMSTVVKNDTAYYKKSLEGIREIYEKHTYKHRLNYILKNMDIDLPVLTDKVCMMAIVESVEEIEMALEIFKKQSYQNKKLALFIRSVEDFADFNSILNHYQTKTVSCYLLSYMDNYTDCEKVLEADYMTLLNFNHFYGSHYLKDLMLATLYTDADFIGKATYYENKENQMNVLDEGLEYIFVDHLYPSRSVMRTSYPFRKTMKVLLESFEQDENLESYARFGAKMFSVNRFNFIEKGAKAGAQQLTQVEI